MDGPEDKEAAIPFLELFRFNQFPNHSLLTVAFPCPLFFIRFLRRVLFADCLPRFGPTTR